MLLIKRYLLLLVLYIFAFNCYGQEAELKDPQIEQELKGWKVSAGASWRSGVNLKTSDNGSHSSDWFNQLSKPSNVYPTGIGSLNSYADRDYDNGFVYKDNSTDNPDADPDALGSTWYWGYMYDNQYSASEGILSFYKDGGANYYLNSSTGDGIYSSDEDYDKIGFILTLRKAVYMNDNVWVNVALGINITPDMVDSSSEFSNFTGAGIKENFRVIDTYYLRGVVPPDAPYEGRYDPPGQGEDPQPVIQNIPDVRNERITSVEETSYENQIFYDNNLDIYSVYLAPEFQYFVSDYFSVFASVGIEANVMSADFSRNEKLFENGSELVQEWNDSVDSTDLLFGANFKVGMQYVFADKYILGANASYSLPFDTETYDVGSETIEVDLESFSVDFEIGILF